MSKFNNLERVLIIPCPKNCNWRGFYKPFTGIVLYSGEGADIYFIRAINNKSSSYGVCKHQLKKSSPLIEVLHSELDYDTLNKDVYPF